MTVKSRVINALVAGLFAMSIAGAYLHYKYHSAQTTSYGFVPMIFGILGTVSPFLFLSKRTAHLGYLLVGWGTVVGTVTMSHFSLVKNPLWLDVAILWAKFFMGYALFNVVMFNQELNLNPGLKTIRYPHIGFWVVHLITFGAVYAVGVSLQ